MKEVGQSGGVSPISTEAESGLLDRKIQPKVRRQIRGDLDVITLKALRKEPQRRYASVEQLAQDIRRHLEGLPVQAAPASLKYRVRKFVGRHKMGVLATVVIVMAIAGGVVTTIREARVAANNQHRAEQRFNDVRKLANSLIFEIHDSIEDLPGATPARKLIVERALEYLGSLARESQGDPSLQRELASAYKRVGDVQGGPFAANLGDSAGALKSYRNAISIRQSLLNSTAGSLEDRIGFAEASRLAAAVLTVSGDTTGAQENTRRAVQVLEKSLPTNSNNLKLKRELMLDYGAEADVLASFLISSNFNSVSSALPLRRKQLELAEELNSGDAKGPEAQRSFTQALNLMGDQLLLAGQRKEALPYYGRALPVIESMATGSTNTKLLLELHDTYYRLEPVEVAEGEIEMAVKSGRRALSIAQQVSSADSQNTQALLIVAADFSNLADALSRAGHKQEAKEAKAKALDLDEELVRRYPKSAQFRHMRPSRFQAAGDIYFRSDEYGQALRYYRQAVDILQGMKAEDPANKWTVLRLAMGLNGIGATLTKMQDLSGAAKSYKQALDLLSDQVGAEVASEDALYGYADSAFGLGEIEAILGTSGPNSDAKLEHLRQALLWYDTSLKTWRRVREPGLVSPTGFACTSVVTVTARRSQCLAQLALLKRDGAPEEEAARR